jgi:simple sugar transport system substrate-binding protein
MSETATYLSVTTRHKSVFWVTSISEENMSSRRGFVKTAAGTGGGLLVGALLGYYGGISTVKPPAGVVQTTTVTETVSAPPPASKPEYTFYLIGWSLTDQFLGSIKKGCDVAGEMTNSKVVVVEACTPSCGPGDWTRSLEQAIAAKPDGIIASVAYAEAEDAAFRRAYEEDIPVLCYNNPDTRPVEQRVPYIGYVGQTAYLCGRAVAERAIRDFTPTEVAILQAYPGMLFATERTRGMMDVFRDKIPNLSVDVVDFSVVQTNQTQAVELLRSYVSAHPNVNLLLGQGPQETHAMLDMVEEQNLAGKIKIAAIDVSDRTLEGIEAGKIITTISQQPFYQGLIPTIWLWAHLKYGFIPPAETFTGPTVVDASSLADIRLQLESTGAA